LTKTIDSFLKALENNYLNDVKNTI